LPSTMNLYWWYLRGRRCAQRQQHMLQHQETVNGCAKSMRAGDVLV
jgi:hypothetical protein